MPLTPAQLPTLKTNIAANSATIPAGYPWSGVFVGQAINALPSDSDADVAIAGWYNLAASPAWTIWRKAVPLSEIAKSLNGAELAGLTSLNHTRLQTVITLINASGGLDASDADMRAFFDDIFSGAGGVTTRANLLVLWKKLATSNEKLFSTGTGSDVSPATTAVNFGEFNALSAAEVDAARNLA